MSAAPALAPVSAPHGTSKWRVTASLSFAVALAYAVVRYHVFGGVDWQQFPLFILNKAVSLTAALLLAAAYLMRDKFEAKRFGLTGCALAVLHVLMSMALLTPANYPKLFDGGRFTFDGSVCILAGCLGLLLLGVPALSSSPLVERSLRPEQWRRWQRLGYAMLALGAIHVGALGYKGWTQPQTWPGGMPPITLLCFAVFVLPLARRLRTER